MRSIPVPAPLRGSSLVETLVATALGLLALVLSSNSVLAFVAGEQRGAGAKALAASIEFARAEAAQRRSPVAICGLDPNDAGAAAGEVHCAAAGSPWSAGWIVYGDTNFNGELDDGEAVLQVIRQPRAVIHPDRDTTTSAALTFRPIGTLAHTAARRIVVADGAQASTQAVCVGVDGFTRVLGLAAPCR
jgi:Tfp pilus assembly protein FimT